MSVLEGLFQGWKGQKLQKKGSRVTTGTGRTDLDHLRIRRLILGPCLKIRFPNVAIADTTLSHHRKPKQDACTKHPIVRTSSLFPSSSR